MIFFMDKIQGKKNWDAWKPYQEYEIIGSTTQVI